MKLFLEYLIPLLVDKPQEVTINQENLNDLIILKISVHKDDMGKIIGREGKIIQAIRNVIKILAVKEKKQVRVELIEAQT